MGEIEILIMQVYRTYIVLYNQRLVGVFFVYIDSWVLYTILLSFIYTQAGLHSGGQPRGAGTNEVIDWVR